MWRVYDSPGRKMDSMISMLTSRYKDLMQSVPEPNYVGGGGAARDEHHGAAAREPGGVGGPHTRASHDQEGQEPRQADGEA